MDEEGLSELIDLLEYYGWEVGLPIADEEGEIQGYIIGSPEHIKVFTDAIPGDERDGNETIH